MSKKKTLFEIASKWVENKSIYVKASDAKRFFEERDKEVERVRAEQKISHNALVE